MKHFHSVILAGGNGERLWPYSRRDRPKQFLPFRGDTTLFEQTLERCMQLSSNIWVVTTKQHEERTKFLLPPYAHIIVEPCKRDTAPAIALTVQHILYEDPDAVLGIFPSDHYMDGKAFVKTAREVYSYVQNHPVICLLGKKPEKPVTSYGYIEAQVPGDSIARITKFHEKPSQDIAEKYVRDGNKYWNLGMFFARAMVLRDEIVLHAPEVFECITRYIESGDSAWYQDIISRSFDYTVVEKSISTAVKIVDFMWDDVGSLSTFLELQKEYLSSSVIEHDAHNNVVDVPQDKQVVLSGVDDLCIIERDDILYVTRKDEKQRKALISYLSTQNIEHML